MTRRAERSITPALLLELARLSLDAEILPGWRLFDVGWTRDRRALRLELHGEERLECAVEPGDLGLAVRAVSSSGLARSSFAGSRLAASCLVEPGVAARLAARLDLADLSGSWRVASPRPVDLMTPLLPEPAPPSVALPDAAPDAALLRRERVNWERHCGVRPEIVDVGGGDLGIRYPQRDGGAPEFPLLGALRPLDCAILERRAHRDFIRRFGFSIDGDGFARTVPTPATFVRRATAHGIDLAVRPVLRGTAGNQGGAAWSRALLSGEFVVGVPRGWTLRIPGLRVPVSTLAHDLGVHGLALAHVPRALWQGLRQRVAMLARPATALTAWLEGPLTNACWAAWADTDQPEDVPATITTRWEGICATL